MRDRQWVVERLKHSSDGIFITDRLAEEWPPAKDLNETACGVMAIAVSRDFGDFTIWFRPELVTTIKWGGDPTKPVIRNGSEEALSPRTSFAEWKEIVRGRSAPWTAAERVAAFDLRVALFEVVLRRIDAANQARKTASDHEGLLMAELDHRVKNTLANIEALVAHSSRKANTLAEFTEGLTRRIHSMAKAHSLLTESRWEGASLRSLLSEELSHHETGNTVALNGPDMTLTPKAALALSLAVHELATNAAKYGSLSVGDGRVDICWSEALDGGVTMSWTESGGPAVRRPDRRGFGSTLIERALSMETGGVSKINYRHDGVRCVIELPATSFNVVAEAKIPFTHGYKASVPAPDRPRILIVEDSAIVAMTLEEIVDELGFELIGPATRLESALALARTEAVTEALLDVNLDGKASWDVARTLRARGVPFAFNTGSDSATILPDDLVGSHVFSKPFIAADVAQRLKEMVDERVASVSPAAAALADAQRLPEAPAAHSSV